MTTQTLADWTIGPAKHAAVIALSLAVVAAAINARGRSPNNSKLAKGDQSLRVNVNAATSAEIELLPGVGPSLAQRIVESRENQGSFRVLHDLARVRGIGPVLLSRLSNYIRLE